MDPIKEAQIDAAWVSHFKYFYSVSQSRRDKKPLRDRLAEAQNWRCCYCGERMEDGTHAPTLEHIVPLSIGGPDDERNLAVAGRSCNEARSSEIWPDHLEAAAIVDGWG